MRVVENGPSRLVLRDRTSWISFFCWTAALVIAAFAVSRGEPKALVSAGLFCVFGIGFFRNSRVVFDKSSRSCSLTRLDMWRVSRTTVPFDAIQNILVEPMIGNDSPNASLCRLSLESADGVTPLSSSYEPDLARFEAMRELVLTFISREGITFPSTEPVRALISAGRRVDALALLRRRERLTLMEAIHKLETIERGEGTDQR